MIRFCAHVLLEGGARARGGPGLSDAPGSFARPQADPGKPARARRRPGEKWMRSGVDVRSKHGLAFTSQSQWSKQKGVKMLGVPRLDRILDCLDTCWSYVQKTEDHLNHKQLRADLWCNIGQEVSRLPVSRGNVPCLATSSLLYSFQEDRLLSGAAHMQLMGWPSNLCTHEGFPTQADYRALAGAAFSCPIAAILTSVLYSNPFAPWW